jgi:SAM-dependent methyltransferase
MRFVQTDCEQSGLPSGSFDVAMCGGVLHHLDLTAALSELQRLLRPGGMLLAVEPLNINPAFQLYRKLTAHLRTEYEAEHILSLRDIKLIGSFFEIDSVRYFHQLSPLAAFLHRTPVFSPVLVLTDAIDQVLTRLPLVRLMSWQIFVSARKALTLPDRGSGR